MVLRLDLKMNRCLSVLLFFGLVWGQTTIAVFDFENNGLKDSEVRILTDRLQSELVQVGGYKLVERQKIDKILKEQNLHLSGIIDEEHLIHIGQMLGAELIVIGNIGKLENIYTISARLVNVETSEIFLSANYDTGNDISNLLTIGMENIARQLYGSNNKNIIKLNDEGKKIDSHNTLLVNDLENKNIIILNIKKKVSNDGSDKVYVTYQQKISYKPSIIMIDWFDTDGVPINGEKKYTKSKMLKDEIRSVSFYVPEDAFDYRVRLKN